MRRNFLYMGMEQCVNVRAGHKQRLGVRHWFSACCSRTRIKQKRHKAHNAVMLCGFILINEKLGQHSQHSDRCIVAFLLNSDLVN